MNILSKEIISWIEKTSFATANITSDVQDKKYYCTAGYLYSGINYDEENPTLIYTDPKFAGAATALIISALMRSANFLPGVNSDEVNAVAFTKFQNNIYSCPFLRVIYNHEYGENISSTDYNSFIDQIVSIYKTSDLVDDTELANLRENMINMAKSVFSKERDSDWDNLFAQTNTGAIKNDAPICTILNTTLYMEHVKKKKEIKTQKYNANLMKIEGFSALYPLYADYLVKHFPVIPTSEMLEEGNSPFNPTDVPCFMR